MMLKFSSDDQRKKNKAILVRLKTLSTWFENYVIDRGNNTLKDSHFS